LGRQFLTAAYFSLNYDTSTFSLWQANPTTQQNLVALDKNNEEQPVDCSSASSSASSTPSSSSSSEGNNGLSGGAVAGIVVGAVVVVLIAGGVIGFFIWRKKKAAAKQNAANIEAVPQSDIMDHKDVVYSELDSQVHSEPTELP
jgi:uncharacterized membrane protein YebE (DUF533 family)